MNPLRISVNKFLSYQKQPLTISNSFYNTVKDALQLYNEFECCDVEVDCGDINLKEYVQEKMRKYLLPDILFKYVYFYLSIKLKCAGRNCCGNVQ